MGNGFPRCGSGMVRAACWRVLSGQGLHSMSELVVAAKQEYRETWKEDDGDPIPSNDPRLSNRPSFARRFGLCILGECKVEEWVFERGRRYTWAC